MACIIVRFVWVFISIYVGDGDRRRGRASKSSKPKRWKQPFFIAWAGLRGADSLVIALALPLTIHVGAPFPSRDLIIFVTFGVIFCTLVLQGFSLAPLVRKLGLEEDGSEANEERLVRVAMADAALDQLREISKSETVPAAVVEKLREEYQHRRRAAKQTHVPQTRRGFDAAAYRALRRAHRVGIVKGRCE